jgi:hypothetical protein
MSFGLDAKNSLLSTDMNSVRDVGLYEQRSIAEAASFAYGFFFRQFRETLTVALFPFCLAGLLLYAFLNGYLSKLLLFLSAPNPHAASLGLGLLAAGIFLSLFCYTVAIAAVAELVQGRQVVSRLFRFKAQRQEWRLYAAYLRFLFLLTIIIASLSFLVIQVLPHLSLSRTFAGASAAILGFIAACWLTVRVGFLIAPLAAEKEGSILRRALQLSSRETLRISGLVILLVLPGLLIQTLGEYALRAWAEAPPVMEDIPVADYARFMERMLPGFLVVVSLSLFVTIVLLTAGAVAFYEKRGSATSPK